MVVLSSKYIASLCPPSYNYTKGREQFYKTVYINGPSRLRYPERLALKNGIFISGASWLSGAGQVRAFPLVFPPVVVPAHATAPAASSQPVRGFTVPSPFHYWRRWDQ